jgi:hypothetical protein
VGLSRQSDRVAEWILLDGNRLAVAGIVLALLAAILATVERLG